tara:strand:+ start:503 stop:874 length:372 start_codon:yes stop_codon:yes gene_type:complete
MKKPDNVADNPGLLPYGSNVGAPSIRVDDIQSWKLSKVHKVNKEFEDRFNVLKSEYANLIEESMWNDIIYSSEFNFEPVVGEIYHLYRTKNDKPHLSLIGPDEWKKECLGSFKLSHNNKWVKI